jgi:histidine triad (HIT) family protein
VLKIFDMPNGKDCPFCRIVEGDLSHAKLVGYSAPLKRNPKFMAFFDHNPVAKYHTLVIPTRHYESIWQMNKNDLTEFITYLRFIVVNLKEKTQSRSTRDKWPFTFIYGQHVKHAHVHVIPYESGFATRLEQFNANFKAVPHQTNNTEDFSRFSFPVL